MPEARRVPATHPDAIALLAAMEAELSAVYGPLTIEHTPSAKPEDLAAFVVVYDDDGRPVAGGGVKRLGDDLGEIKRMYVVPEARSRGLARQMLAALEDAARDLGHSRVRLDTGPEQPHARALYSSAGYVEIPDYNDNRYADYWAEKALTR